MDEKLEKNNKSNKFKLLLQKFKSSIKVALKEFPVTIILLIVTTILYTIYADNNFNIGYGFQNMFKRIILFFTYEVVASLLLESLFIKQKDKFKEYILMLFSLIPSILFAGIDIFEQNIVLYNIILRLNIIYIVTFLSLTIYYNFKNSKLNFNEYVYRVFSNLLQTVIVYIIIAGITALISIIFSNLIFNKFDYMLLVKLELLITGIIFMPLVIKSISNVDDKPNDFFEKLIKYVLLPLIVIAYIIIYMYVVKIIILGQIPSNELYRIALGLFIASYIITRLSKKFDSNNIIRKINKGLLIAFIPILLVQIYSIITRTIEFGFTPIRYLGIMVIILEIICIVLEKIKKGKEVSKVLFFFIGLVIISVIVPFINMYNVSAYSQYKIIKNYINSNDNKKIDKYKIDKNERDELDKASNAYKYLYENKMYVYYLIKNFDKEELENVIDNCNYLNRVDKGSIDDIGYNMDDNTSYGDCFDNATNNLLIVSDDKDNTNKINQSKCIFLHANFIQEEEKIDISKYSMMQYVKTANQSFDQYSDMDLNNIKIYSLNDINQCYYINLSDKLNSYIKNLDNNLNRYDALQNIVSKDRIIKIDDNHDLYIESLDLKYDIENKKVSSLIMTAILFEKNN